jgi:release factor glutamine methyltransferase
MKFDLIISNPPYIPSSDIAKLEPEIREFEPMLALDGGKDGLNSIRFILKKAHCCLAPGGVILLEIGFDQKDRLINIVNKYSQYPSIKFIKDLSGHNRVALIKKSIDK